MSSLLPLKPADSSLIKDDAEPKLINLTDAAAEDVLSSVSSTTSRTILEAIYDEPQTASEIADKLDLSVQNVSYHLEKLTGAELIEVAGTWYSERGREMDVYVPANGPLVLYVGAEQAEQSLSTALRRVLGGVGVVGVTSALVHSRWTPPQPEQVGSMTVGESADPTRWETVLSFLAGPGGLVLGIGLFVIACWFTYWYWRRYRPYRDWSPSSA